LHDIKHTVYDLLAMFINVSRTFVTSLENG